MGTIFVLSVVTTFKHNDETIQCLRLYVDVTKRLYGLHVYTHLEDSNDCTVYISFYHLCSVDYGKTKVYIRKTMCLLVSTFVC